MPIGASAARSLRSIPLRVVRRLAWYGVSLAGLAALTTAIGIVQSRIAPGRLQMTYLLLVLLLAIAGGSGPVARIGVALRHRAGLASGQEPIRRYRDLAVDLGRHVVMLDGDEIHLTPTEYELLRCLISATARTLTHGQVLREIWGPEHESEIQPLRFAVFQLRRKLRDDPLHPRYIITEPGIGYRLGWSDAEPY
ncbi:MAG TPA: winged helix-turn-helix domain-containing protein [Dehalococcoidia bacterium]|nr:winged helix-turn-helix domain-containing protein [Dehalococcoidia bacterium]